MEYRECQYVNKFTVIKNINSKCLNCEIWKCQIHYYRIFTEGEFTEVRYDYQCEGVLITDTEVISTVNDMIESFHGVIRYLKES